jgi:hypothetical protein
MNSIEMNTIIGEYYNLGAVYCRKILSKGGESIFMHNSLITQILTWIHSV